MGSSSKKYRNYLAEVSKIIDEIVCLKPEPEICNIRCPPLGCPRGPCPGACSYEGVPDACCISTSVPCCSPPQPLLCQAPPICYLKTYAKAVGYPPESCLSPPSVRFRKSACHRSLCSPPQPPCYSPPGCTTPCSCGPPSPCF